MYHLQNKGENKGISQVVALVNSVTGSSSIRKASLITSGDYALLEDDPIVNELLESTPRPSRRLCGS